MMARKPNTQTSKKTSTASTAATAAVTTPIRQTPIPRKAAAKAQAVPAAKVITHDMIAKRAYEIFLSGTGGTAEENWHRAERELRGA